MASTDTVQDAISEEQMHNPIKQTVGLLVEDGTCRRLIEGVVTNLDLIASVVKPNELDAKRITDFELIVADVETPVLSDRL